MSVYTRKGDGGYTRLADGTRVPKSHRRIRAVGTVDELNAALGLARSLAADPGVKAAVAEIQPHLFKVGAALSSPTAAQVDPEWIAEFERSIDAAEAELPPQHTWILPGDTPGSGALHLARATCRRAERAVVRLVVDHSSGEEAAGGADGAEVTEAVLRYLNRLSDYLHILSRLEDHRCLVRRVCGQVRAGLAQAIPAAETPAPTKSGELTAAQCERILALAESKARAIGVPMVIAIVDAGGNLKAFKRMDGALLVSIDLAVGKAYTSAAMRMSTRAVGELAQPGAPLYGIENSNQGRVVTVAGGVPLQCGGLVVGGLGVSGGSVEQDEAVALAGCDGLGSPTSSTLAPVGAMNHAIG